MTLYESEVRNKIERKNDDHQTVFQRHATILFINAVSLEPVKSSPIRQGSYDLLFLLSLHESILRVLRDYQESSDEKRVSFRWLKEFFFDRLETHFDGPKPYGRADDFIEELLLSTPLLRNALDGRHMELIDPLKIASDILSTRTKVLEDWRQLVSRVPEDHLGLRKALLLAQSEQWNKVDNEATNSESDGELGVFQ